MQHDETIDSGGPLAREQGADLAAFYDRRAAAALAYCSRLCAPEAIADAVEAAFARVFEAAAAGEATDERALDARLRSAVRSEAARRSAPAGAGVPARRLLERLADPNRGGACELMPALLAARADDSLSGGDRERMQAHLRRCADCRLAEQRFAEAERAFDALAGDDAPALGRSLLAEMLTDAPLGARRRFARERLAAEPPDWLEEIDWHDEPAPRVVEVPDDALDEVESAAGLGADPAEALEADPAEAFGADAAEALEAGPADVAARPAVVEPAPRPEPVDTEEWDAVRPPRAAAPRGPEPGTRRGPRLGHRARRRLALALLVLGVLLLGEAAATVLWKEPLTAYLAARAQDDLSDQLQKLDSDQAGIGGDDAKRLAAIRDSDERAKQRMALLARRERTTVPSGDALGLLRIGRIDAEYVLVQGTDGASLRTGPAHYLKTALPGEGGVVGLAGHRTTYEAPFRQIDELEPGDTITLKMPYGLFTYTVERHRIVPADFADAFADTGTETLVLSACHPLYSASERILVYARLTNAQPLGAAVESSQEPTGPTARQQQLKERALRLERMGKRTLGAGMTGSDVKEVQRLLGLPTTGTYGPETTAAVLEFQRRRGLPQVGQVGPQTKAALARRRHLPSRPPTPPPVARQVPQPTQPTQPTQTAPYGQTQPTQPTYTQPPSSGTGTAQPYSNP